MSKMPKLVIDQQPPAEWFKDEGDKHFNCSVRLEGSVTQSVFGTHDRIPVHVELRYESGRAVEDQHSLLECIPTAPVMDLKEKHCAMRIRIKEVSSRHRHQQFTLVMSLAGIPAVNSVLSDPIRVLSKQSRYARRRKRQREAEAAAAGHGFDQELAKLDPVALTVEVLASLEWTCIGRGKSVYQCPVCMAVYQVGINTKHHKPRCKLRHLLSVLSSSVSANANAAAAAAATSKTKAAAASGGGAAAAGRPQTKRANRGTAAARRAAAAAALASATPLPQASAAASSALAMPALSSQTSLRLEQTPSFGSLLGSDGDLITALTSDALGLSQDLPAATSASGGAGGGAGAGSGADGTQESLGGKLARQFSVSNLLRTFSWGKSSTDGAS